YVADNGHAMAPYMMSVGLWVGSIAFCLMYPLTSCPGKMDSGLKWWFSKASVLVVTAVLQAVVMLAALAVFDGFDPERAGLTALRSEEHTSELQSRFDLVCRLLLEEQNMRDDV